MNVHVCSHLSCLLPFYILHGLPYYIHALLWLAVLKTLTKIIVGILLFEKCCAASMISVWCVFETLAGFPDFEVLHDLSHYIHDPYHGLSPA